MLGAERAEPAGGARRGGDGGIRARGVDLIDPGRDEVLADGRRVRLGEDVLHLVVGRRRDPVEDLVGVVVAGLDAFEVEDREPAEAGSRRRTGRRRRRPSPTATIGMPSVDAAEVLREHDVGRLDRVRAGGERDVLEAVGRADRVDLRAEDPPVRQRLGLPVVLSRVVCRSVQRRATHCG